MTKVIRILDVTLCYLSLASADTDISQRLNLPDTFGKREIISNDHPSFTACNVLGTLEAETSSVANRTYDLALIRAEKTLGIVLQNEDIVLFRQFHNQVHVWAQPVERYRNNCAGTGSDAGRY